MLWLVEGGRSNRQIAEELRISARTVTVHITHILAKLSVGNRPEAVAVARRRGVFDHAEPPADPTG